MRAAAAWVRSRRGVLGINRRNLDLVFRDYRPGSFRVLDDKIHTKAVLARADVAVPTTLDVFRSPSDLARFRTLLATQDAFVVKPARGWGGRGILVLERRDGGWIRPDGAPCTDEALASHVRDILSGVFSLDEEEDAALFEERIVADPFFTRIYPDGLADLRLVVKDGEPIQAMCRIPTRRSGGKANLHGGGVGAGIRLATGALTGGVCSDRPVSSHPDTGVALEGLRVPAWDRCVELARRASRAVGFDYVGVDLVIDRVRGPLVLEVNARPGLAIQIANRHAQPVASAPAASVTGRITTVSAFALFGLLILVPPLLDAWEGSRPAAPREQAVGPVAGSASEAVPENGHGFGQEWDDEDIPASTLSGNFSEARAAAAAGDTARAIELYRAALGEESVAAFAGNNLALLRKRAGDPEGALALLDEALAGYPAYSRGHYNRGLVLEELGREDEAIEAFRAALEIRPGHALSWAALGEIHFDRREFADAARAFEEALRFSPASESYRMRAGLSLRLLGEFESAAGRFHEVLRLDPGDEAAAYWWARSELDAGAGAPGADAPPDSALVAVLEPHATADEPSWRCAGLLGILRRTDGDPVGALKLFERVRKNFDPGRAYTRASAETAVQLGLWELANRRIRRLDGREADVEALREWSGVGRFLDLPLRAARSDPDALAALDQPFRDPAREALRLRLLGKTGGAEAVSSGPAAPRPLAGWIEFRLVEERSGAAAAREAFESVGAGAPDFYPLLRERLRDAAREGRDADARKVARRMLALDPFDHDLRIRLGGLELRAGRESRARALLRRVPDARRALPDARTLEAAILRAEGQPRESVSILEEVLRMVPEDVEARVELAQALVETNHARGATRELRAARDMAPDRVDVRETLARVLMGRRKYDEAAAEWRRVVQLDATPSRRFNHALALQRADQPEAAADEYERVIRDDADNYRAWFNRALAFQRMGRAQEAREGFRRVLELNPQHAASREKLRKMEGS